MIEELKLFELKEREKKSIFLKVLSTIIKSNILNEEIKLHFFDDSLHINEQCQVGPSVFVYFPKTSFDYSTGENVWIKVTKDKLKEVLEAIEIIMSDDVNILGMLGKNYILFKTDLEDNTILKTNEITEEDKNPVRELHPPINAKNIDFQNLLKRCTAINKLSGSERLDIFLGLKERKVKISVGETTSSTIGNYSVNCECDNDIDVTTRVSNLMLGLLIDILQISQIKNCEFHFSENNWENMVFKFVYDFDIGITINVPVSIKE